MVKNLRLWVSLQMILYDTPGVIEKKMHKLDSMMMNNVRSAGINADCVLVVVDASKMPQKVSLMIMHCLFVIVIIMRLANLFVLD